MCSLVRLSFNDLAKKVVDVDVDVVVVVAAVVVVAVVCTLAKNCFPSRRLRNLKSLGNDKKPEHL